MSQQNVEIVRRMLDGFLAFQAGDPTRLADALVVLDPDIRWHGTVGGLDEGQVAHGYEEVARAFRENFETCGTDGPQRSATSMSGRSPGSVGTRSPEAGTVRRS